MAAAQKGRGVHAIGQHRLEKSCSILGKSIYVEKKERPFNSSGLGSQTGTFACPEGLTLASCCLSWAHDGPASTLPVKSEMREGSGIGWGGVEGWGENADNCN